MDGCEQKSAWRVWRRLGFGWASCPNMEDLDADARYCESRLSVETVVHFDWLDRLRILVSGRVHVAASVKTDKPIIRSIARSRVSVLPPFGEQSPAAGQMQEA